MKYFAIFSIILLASCGTSSQKTEYQENPIDLRTQIEAELNRLNRFDNSLFQKNIFSLKTEVAFFLKLAIVVEQAFADKDPETIKLGRTLSEKLEEIQTKEFPLIRKRYIELLTTRLNLYDAKAECGGELCNTLRTTSGQFDSWDITERQVRNRRNFQSVIKDEVRLFRFQSVSYEEKKEALGTFSFQIKSLYDNEIAILNSKPGAAFELSLFERDLKKVKFQTESELNRKTSHLSTNKFNGDIPALKLLVANYFDIAIVIEEAINSGDSSIVQMGFSLRNKLKEIQLKEFSIIRKLYADLAVNELLRYDATVKCLDNTCESITIASKDFNAKTQVNINKRSACIQIMEKDLKLFRFKLAKYAETESEPHALRATIKSLDDDEIVLYKSSTEATYHD